MLLHLQDYSTVELIYKEMYTCSCYFSYHPVSLAKLLFKTMTVVYIQ